MSVKEKYPETSTNRGQRIAIWIIAIVMTGGTLISFLIFAIASMNPDVNSDQILYEKALENYQKQQEEQAEAEQAVAKDLAVFGGYEKEDFKAEDVKKLSVETLKKGDGKTVAATDTISAYYTGWRPDGTIFDSTADVNGGNEARSFSLAQVITGWTEGLTGTKVGGVYRLTIPAEQAYGENGSGSLIPPNTPLKFIVEIVGIEEAQE
ncbi:MAG: FKBP-type peptidyl-prolyl cis-trans isomerase [Candidatus Nomurabacteria bacterium]|jgi:FKBP-type peptidyl-prolyl cis-trans isomerase|nr:FKBP-type peptidyl-prolyl cis-trans isomerase [Candidatus Nomurabacteria bacterium]